MTAYTALYAPVSYPRFPLGFNLKMKSQLCSVDYYMRVRVLSHHTVELFRRNSRPLINSMLIVFNEKRAASIALQLMTTLGCCQ